MNVANGKPDAEITSDLVAMEIAARKIAQALEHFKEDDGIDRFVRIHVFKDGRVLVWAQLNKKHNTILRDAVAIVDPENGTITDLHRLSRSNDDNPWLAELRWEDLLQKGRAE